MNLLRCSTSSQRPASKEFWSTPAQRKGQRANSTRRDKFAVPKAPACQVPKAKSPDQVLNIVDPGRLPLRSPGALDYREFGSAIAPSCRAGQVAGGSN